jgi:hypothetical protein
VRGNGLRMRQMRKKRQRRIKKTKSNNREKEEKYWGRERRGKAMMQEKIWEISSKMVISK